MPVTTILPLLTAIIIIVTVATAMAALANAATLLTIAVRSLSVRVVINDVLDGGND